jgi:hypothetical protein
MAMPCAVPAVPRHRSRPTPLPPLTSLATALALRNVSIEVLPLVALKRSREAARKHPQKQLTQIAASIREYGFNTPVAIDGTDTIIAGHARVAAAKLAGLKEIPTVRLSHLSPSQVRAYALADNKLAEGATWDDDMLKVVLTDLCASNVDFDVEAIGFDPVEVDVIIHGTDDTAPEDQCDEVLPQIRKVAVSRSGDVWRLDRHMFACADALDATSYALVLGDAKATLIISDAPYNVPIQRHVSGLGRHQHREFAMASGEMTPAEFTAFLRTVFGHLAAHSVDGSLHYLFMDHRHMDEILAAGGATYKERKNLLVWKKTNASMGSQYRSQHELIFLYKHGSAPHINNIQLGSNGRYRTNVLEYAGANVFRAERDEELERHPTPKPVTMIEDLIRDSSHINDWVLDCFVGGGTIFIAAEKTHRRAAGIEIDPLYSDLSIERWQALTGKSAVLVSTGQTFAEVAQVRLARAADTEKEAQS